MKTTLLVLLSAIGSLLLGEMALAEQAMPDAGTARSQRAELYQTMDQGNYKDAYDGLRKILLAPGQPTGDDLARAVQCLLHLDRTAEIDDLLEAAVKAQQDDPRRWRFLADVAHEIMVPLPKNGCIIAGKFYRGPQRGGGRYVTTVTRDRGRALQLMTRALPNALKDDDHSKVGKFLLELADTLATVQGWWRLQEKTDLSVLPDYEEGYGRWGFRGGAKARRSMPTASQCSIASPRVSRPRKTTASAGAGASLRPPSSIRSAPTRRG